MTRKRVRQYLMLLIALGVIAFALSGGNGTFASFNAQVANKDNTFATGTLYLHETDTNTCTSESASSNSNLNTSGVHLGDACDVLFSGVNSSGYSQVGLTMKNAGSLDGDGLQLALGNTADGFPQSGCVSSQTFDSLGTVAHLNGTLTTLTGDGSATLTEIDLAAATTVSLYSGETVELDNGTDTQTFTTSAVVDVGATTIPVTSTVVTNGDTFAAGDDVNYSFATGSSTICGDLKMSIVEVPTAGDLSSVTLDPTTGDTSAPAGSICVYDDEGGTPTTNGSNGCNGTDGEPLSSISNYSTFDSLSLKDLSASTDPNTATGLDAGTDRYIVISIFLDDPPAPNNNDDQDQSAAFDLAWNMNQATS